MPNAAIVDLADALVTDLNVPSRFSQAIAATRVPFVNFELKDNAGLVVRVVPNNETVIRADRARRQYDYQLDVGVLKRIGVATNTLVDPLLYLCEQITDWWFTHTPTGRSEVLLSATPLGPYSAELLQSKHTFASVTRLTFRGWR